MDRWKATWDAGLNKRPGANTNNTPVGVIPDNTEFNVVIYFIPTGKTAAQEYWGRLEDESWVALVYNSQVRAERVTVTPTPTPTPTPVLPVKPLNVTISFAIDGYEEDTATVTLNPKAV